MSRGSVTWCPDHDAPITDPSGDCWQCRLEWEATDQAAAAAAARAALARPRRPAAGPALPSTASADQRRLEQLRARLDQRDDQVPGQLELEP